jgi:hypothetical protein
MAHTLDALAFCKQCLAATPREVRCRSDDEFIGRVLVCEYCGDRTMEALNGTGCSDC